MRIWIWLALVAGLHAQWIPANAVTGVKQEVSGVLLTMQTGAMRIEVDTDSIIHVIYSPTASFPTQVDYVVTKTTWPAAQWKMESNAREVSLVTPRLKVSVSKSDGVITYTDSSGKKLVAEGPKTMTPAVINGENTYHAEDNIAIYGSEEAFYGLGQHQAGVWNYRGESVDVSQDNTSIAVPLLVSTNGYGLFWNNTSRCRFNNRFVHSLYISSEVADTIDYYFLYGPDFDKVIAGYRELTGAAPMFGKWAYGFWQCKNKYQSQQELLAVAHKYRELHIPVDNIVQDWFWWTTKGEFVFNKNYPDAKGMIDDLHANHFHLMISVWPYFDPGTATYTDMDKRGFFIDRTKVRAYHPAGMAVYDATNPAARAYYWNLMDKALFQIGADAWWLDTTEPETEGREENLMLNNKLAIGSGARYANLFPLMTTTAVYEGQRKASDRKRVYILSRSAFAGAQRNAVTAWSGDILSDWESYKRQIPAGLNFSLSGIPYWTTDIGGFFIGNPNDPGYRELFVRWFQYGTFCPIFRVHGTRTTNRNELWSYGADAQAMLTKFDQLRYKLLPYTYSVAWMTTHESYTPMRPLVMDFQADVRAQNIGDQFMYGPAILVSPVTEPGAVTRHLYLPKTQWYDFWTGRAAEGGRAIDAAAPLDSLPLYVRAGLDCPDGAGCGICGKKPADPIELRVYRGAGGSFTLYEDEGDSYDYEKGVYATIPMHWDEAAGTLTISERTGRFPGMLESRTFRVVFVSPAGQTDKVVRYAGRAVTVTP